MATFQGAFDNDTGTTAATSLTVTNVTVSAGSNLCMAIGVSLEDDVADNVTGVTFNGSGVGMARVAQQGSGASFGRADLWRLLNPAVTTASVVVNLDASDIMVVGVVVATLVDQTTPMRAAATDSSGSDTTVSSTVGSVGTDDLVIDVIALDSNVTATDGADQDPRWNVPITGKVTGAGSTQLGSAGGVMSWTWAGGRPCAQVASAFVHDGSGGGGATTWGPLIGLRNNRLVGPGLVQ